MENLHVQNYVEKMLHVLESGEKKKKIYLKNWVLIKSNTKYFSYKSKVLFYDLKAERK